MESFFSKADTSSAERRDNGGGHQPLRPTKPRAKPKNLLFNPQPQHRQRPNLPAGHQGQHGGGGSASSYWKVRTSKLSEQTPAAVSQIFSGLSFYFNGRSGEKQTMHLKGAVSKYGGRTTPFMSMTGVTHVIAENLSAVKTDKAMKSLKMKVVHPDWLTRCIAEGRLLPDAPFRVVRGQKLGMDNFLHRDEHGSAHKEKKRRERYRSTPGSSVIDGGGDGGGGSGGSREGRKSVSLWNGGGGAAAQGCRAGLAAGSLAAGNRDVDRRGTGKVGSKTSACSCIGKTGSRSGGGGGGSSSSSSSCRKCKENSAVGSPRAGDGLSAVFDCRSLSGSAGDQLDLERESGLGLSRSDHAATGRKRCRSAVSVPHAVGVGARLEGRRDCAKHDGPALSPSILREKRQRLPRSDERLRSVAGPVDKDDPMPAAKGCEGTRTSAHGDRDRGVGGLTGGIIDAIVR